MTARGTVVAIRIFVAWVLSAGVLMATPLGTGFVYQGQLKVGGIPITASADFQFTLHDDVVGGIQVGGPIAENDVSVVNGLFSVEVDFGVDAFNGEDRFLGIQVRSPAGAGAFSPLDPRQRVTAAPYALQVRGMFVNSTNDGNLVGRFFVDESAGFVGVNRFARVNEAEYFGINAPVGDGAFGGMYIRTDGAAGQPFYGYSTAGDIDAYHYFDGSSDAWKLWIGGVRMTVERATGNVGIGTAAPTQKLDVAGSIAVAGDIQIQPGNGVSVNDGDLILGGANVVINLGDSTADIVTIPGDVNLPNDDSSLTFAAVSGPSAPMIQMFASGSANADRMVIAHSPPFQDWGLQYQDVGDRFNFLANGNSVLSINLAGGPRLDVAGTARVDLLEIDGGADLSESFSLNESARPGMVVAIDPDCPGALRVARGEYNRRVAGIVSGAGGIKTGMIMGQPGSLADGDHAVALTGRVYCLCDASDAAIAPGDLLTTSATPGHAMKVTDYVRAQGAVLGKATTALPEGEQGLVLVLVTLQ